MSNANKFNKYLPEAFLKKIRISPPNINVSDSEFQVRGGEIVFPLLGIKGLGSATVDEVVSWRKQNGNFTSPQQFYLDVKPSRDAMEALIKAGAFDSLGYSRKGLLEALAALQKPLQSWKGKLTRLEKKRQKLSEEAWEDLADYQAALDKCDAKEKKDTDEFNATVDEIFAAAKNTTEFTAQEIMDMEHELLGYYISITPLDWAKPVLERCDSCSLDVEQAKEGVLSLGGLISKVRRMKDWAGKPKAFVTVNDEYGQYSIDVPEKLLSSGLKEGNVIAVKGTVKQSPKWGNSIKAVSLWVVSEEMIQAAINKGVTNNNQIVVFTDGDSQLATLQDYYPVISPHKSIRSKKDSFQLVFALLGREPVESGIFVNESIVDNLWQHERTMNVLVMPEVGRKEQACLTSSP